MDVTKQNSQTDNVALEKMITKHLNFLQSLKNVKVAMSMHCQGNDNLSVVYFQIENF